MISTIFKILEYALSIGEEKYRSRYLDRVIKLKKQYYQEVNKNEADQNFAILDNITNELRIITDTLTNFKKQDS